MSADLLPRVSPRIEMFWLFYLTTFMAVRADDDRWPGREQPRRRSRNKFNASWLWNGRLIECRATTRRRPGDVAGDEVR